MSQWQHAKWGSVFITVVSTVADLAKVGPEALLSGSVVPVVRPSSQKKGPGGPEVVYANLCNGWGSFLSQTKRGALVLKEAHRK